MAIKCSVIRDEQNNITQVLAQNGKPSKLYNDILEFQPDKEQALRLYAQIQTPTFKAWFGDSKVVDENGEPLLVYHGTGNRITEFRERGVNQGLGIYLTPSKSFADMYRRIDLNREDLAEGVTMPLFVKIVRPKKLTSNTAYGKEVAFINEVPTEYDGIMFALEEEGGEIVAFNPNQIKSLFNNGNFSSDLNNIYHQKSSTSPFSPDGKLKTLLDRLSSRFGIPYTTINSPEGSLGSFGKEGVVINLAKATAETAFHEFLHPFILVLEQQNPDLYQSLVKELNTTKDGIIALTQTQREYPELSTANQVHEATVAYLGRLAEIKYNQPKSAFNRFVAWIRRLFKKINIDFANVSLTTSLSDIADLIVDDVFVADLKGAIRNADVLIREQKDTELTYTNLFNRIKDRIAILSATLRKRTQGEQFKEDITALRAIFDSSDEITSLNSFIANSLHYVDSAYSRFETLRKDIKNYKNLSQEEISYNLYILGEIQQLLNVFESLNDVQLLFIKEGVKSTADTMARLAEAIARHQIMTNDFKSFAVTYLTDWLYPYIEATNKRLTANQKDLILSKEQFREQMSVATRDITAAGYNLGAVINSQDPVSAAIGLAIKDVAYISHLQNMEMQKKVEQAYKKAQGTSLYTTQEGVAQFNMQYLKEVEQYEQVGVDDQQQPIYDYVPRLAFHTEFNDDQFEKERIEFFKRIGPKPPEAEIIKYNNWKRSVSLWYAQNTQIAANALSTIANNRKEMTKLAYEKWIMQNTKEIEDVLYPSGQWSSDYFRARGILYSKNTKTNTFRIYSGQLISPANKYKNPEFNKMMKDPYYRVIYNNYKESNDKLGLFKLRFGIIPQIPRERGLISTDKNKSLKENIINTLKNPIRGLIAEEESNRTIQRQDGTEVKKIPIRFTSMLNADILSVDLASSIIDFSKMATNYSNMSEIESNILILKTVLNGDFNLGIEGRKIAKTNAKGSSVINAITKKIVPKLAKDDMLNKRLNEFIDDVFYGEEELKDTFELFGKTWSTNRLADKVGAFTSISTMALNINGGISNVIIGNYNNLIETFGGRFWGKRDYVWAQKEYWANIHKSVGGAFGAGDSLLSYISEYYDVPQGEFTDQYGAKVSAGQANKLFRTSNLFFIQNGGEHEIQLTGMLSLMHATKVKTRDGKEITLYDAWKESSTSTVFASPFLNPNIIWTREDDAAFRNRLHAITKNLQGVYNSFDKALLQRRWYGKLALKFRKYMFTAFKSRYGDKYVDYELGTVQEGYWRTFIKKLWKEAKDYKWGMVQRMWSKEGYTDIESAAINRTLFELSVILGIMLLAGLVDDDDDKTWLEAETALQLTRMSADITQFINPADFLRVIRNPAASVNLMEKWIGWTAQLFHPFEEYERSAGIAEKGDNKLYIKTLKLMPITRQLINLLTPEEQIKFYQMTGR